MKKKFIAWLILVLVVLQAFFVPVFAEGEDQNVQYVEKSFSETTILQDFGVSSAEELKTLVGGSFGAGNSIRWEVLNSAFERVGNNYRFFVYLMRRSSAYSISGVNSFDLVLTGTNANGTDFLPVSSTVVSRADNYFVKLQFDLPVSSPFISWNGSDFRIELYSLKPHNVNALQRGFVTQYESGVAESSVGLFFNLNEHSAVRYDRADELELNVTMMSERFSTSQGLHQWKQLNTCAFIIPNVYFERFGDLAVIRYVYDLYEDVPMLVLEKSNDINAAISYLQSTDTNYSSNPFYVQRAIDPFPEEWEYWLVDYCRYFVFPVDEIHQSANDPFDFSHQEAFEHFDRAKSVFLQSGANDFGAFLKASRSVNYEGSLTPYDTWSNLSFADYLDSQNWLINLFYRIGHWGNFIDDSLDNIPAIEVVSESLSDLTSEYISQTYYVDSSYSDTLKSLSATAEGSDGTLVLFRYCMTDYSVTRVDRLFYKDYHNVFGYVCKNAVIDNFKIINFDFKRTEMTPDGPEVIVTTVPVDMDPVPFIEGGQSGQALVDGIVDPFPNPFSWIKKTSNSIWDWIKRIGLIVLAVVVLIVLYKVVTLIVSIASLFKHRRNDDPDPKPKKKSRWLFGRRRE